MAGRQFPRTPKGGGSLAVFLWALSLENTPTLRKRFTDGKISDALIVITYEGELPAWPE
jgi:hypothetical protein